MLVPDTSTYRNLKESECKYLLLRGGMYLSDEGSIGELWIEFSDMIHRLNEQARLADEGEEEDTIEPSDIEDV